MKRAGLDSKHHNFGKLIDSCPRDVATKLKGYMNASNDRVTRSTLIFSARETLGC